MVSGVAPEGHAEVVAARFGGYAVAGAAVVDVAVVRQPVARGQKVLLEGHQRARHAVVMQVAVDEAVVFAHGHFGARDAAVAVQRLVADVARQRPGVGARIAAVRPGRGEDDARAVGPTGLHVVNESAVGIAHHDAADLAEVGLAPAVEVVVGVFHREIGNDLVALPVDEHVGVVADVVGVVVGVERRAKLLPAEANFGFVRAVAKQRRDAAVAVVQLDLLADQQRAVQPQGDAFPVRGRQRLANGVNAVALAGGVGAKVAHVHVLAKAWVHVHHVAARIGLRRGGGHLRGGHAFHQR